MTETTRQKTFKQVCTCQNCGNEAEMIVTCSLEPVEEAPEAQVATSGEPQSEKIKCRGRPPARIAGMRPKY